MFPVICDLTLYFIGDSIMSIGEYTRKYVEPALNHGPSGDGCSAGDPLAVHAAQDGIHLGDINLPPEQFAADSPLEGSGFELTVPQRSSSNRGPRVLRRSRTSSARPAHTLAPEATAGRR